MAQTINPLAQLSDHTAQIVDRVASGVVAVHGGRWPSSGMLWRSGVIVTAEEVVDRDENIAVTLPGGQQVPASLVGRDPSTDIAVLRVTSDGLAPVETVDAATLRSGHIVLAVGSRRGAPVASLGVAAFVGAAWRSQRGGNIDNLIRLDLSLDPGAEGSAVVDARGRVLGMAVSGPRRRVLVIPTATLDRTVDQILAKGYVGRGYLGAGLQHVRLGRSGDGARAADGQHGILVVSIDPEGSAARAGMLVGDIVTAWDAKPVARVRDVMRLLGPDSVGSSIELALLRGGAPTTLKLVLGERPRV